MDSLILELPFETNLEFKSYNSYLKLEYKLVKLSDKKEWFALKMGKIDSGFAFPNLPYMEDGETKISETIAIMVYISEKYGNEKLENDFLTLIRL